jgi:hypothetical protein
VCSLLISNAASRRFVIALKALNLELAQVRDLARNESAAALRFAFWRDSVQQAFDEKYVGSAASESISRELNQVISST